MAMTGKVFKQVETQIATIRITEQATQRLIEVLIGSDVVIKFPMVLTVDTNEIALRTANVINQTGFITNPVRCEVVSS